MNEKEKKEEKIWIDNKINSKVESQNEIWK